MIITQSVISFDISMMKQNQKAFDTYKPDLFQTITINFDFVDCLMYRPSQYIPIKYSLTFPGGQITSPKKLILKPDTPLYNCVAGLSRTNIIDCNCNQCERWADIMENPLGK